MGLGHKLYDCQSQKPRGRLGIRWKPCFTDGTRRLGLKFRFFTNVHALNKIDPRVFRDRLSRFQNYCLRYQRQLEVPESHRPGPSKLEIHAPSFMLLFDFHSPVPVGTKFPPEVLTPETVVVLQEFAEIPPRHRL